MESDLPALSNSSYQYGHHNLRSSSSYGINHLLLLFKTPSLAELCHRLHQTIPQTPANLPALLAIRGTYTLRSPAMSSEVAARNKKACVVGGTGFVASLLIKLLLEKGYSVNTTVRDPGKSLWLLLFLSILFQ